MKKYLFHIKIVLIVLLFLFIFVDVGSKKTSEADIQSVVEEVARTAGTQEVPVAEERMVKRFYGLNPKDYEGVVLYAPQDNMDVHEIFLVKLKDVSQEEAVEAAIEKRLDTQLKSFEGYGIEQTALLKKHVLDVQGNYIFYMVGEKATATHKAFLDSL